MTTMYTNLTRINLKDSLDFGQSDDDDNDLDFMAKKKPQRGIQIDNLQGNKNIDKSTPQYIPNDIDFSIVNKSKVDENKKMRQKKTE